MEDYQNLKEEQNSSEENLSLISPQITDKKEYQYGLDILRFIAMYFVISVHSTSFNKYLKAGMGTFVLFLCGMHRYISFTCCPIFMTLSGYLLKEKKPTLSYFSKIISFVIEYLLCSFVVIIFRVKYLKQNLSSQAILDGFFIFTNAPYAWYVNLYIGLFLFAPYINMLYSNIKSIKQKYIIIIILVLVIVLPSTYYRFGWNFWTNTYPILYYLIGSFIKEYQPKIKKIYLIPWIIVVDIIQALSRKYSRFIIVEEYQDLGCMILSVLIFLLFYNLKAKKCNCFLKIFRKITDTSLSCFLLSYMFEQIFLVEIFNKKGLRRFIDRLPYLTFTIHLTFIGSIIGGLITHNISILLSKSISHFYDRIRECSSNEKERSNIDIN